MIVLRMTHFMKKDDFKKEKKEWEEENPLRRRCMVLRCEGICSQKQILS